MINNMDSKLAAALGTDAESVLPYLADRVDPTRVMLIWRITWAISRAM